MKKSQKYLVCIWCGKKISKPFAMYCSIKCSKESKDRLLAGSKISKILTSALGIIHNRTI